MKKKKKRLRESSLYRGSGTRSLTTLNDRRLEIEYRDRLEERYLVVLATKKKI